MDQTQPNPSQNNFLDTSGQIRYNNNNESHEIVVDMATMPAINDTECRHDVLIPDPEDTIGDAVYHGCANTKCGVGFYIR